MEPGYDAALARFFPPASGWNSFPPAECANEGVSVLVSQEVGTFMQLEHGVIEIVASKLVTSFFLIALEAGSFVLQTPLQSTQAYVQRIRDGLDGRTLNGELFLYRHTDSLDEISYRRSPLSTHSRTAAPTVPPAQRSAFRASRTRSSTMDSSSCCLAPISSTLCDETRDARFHHFIESLPGVDIRPQSILEPAGISSALKGFRRPRNHLDCAKRCPRFSSTPVLFPPAH
jgi:hypothetical protein